MPTNISHRSEASRTKSAVVRPIGPLTGNGKQTGVDEVRQFLGCRETSRGGIECWVTNVNRRSNGVQEARI